MLLLTKSDRLAHLHVRGDIILDGSRTIDGRRSFLILITRSCMDDYLGYDLNSIQQVVDSDTLHNPLLLHPTVFFIVSQLVRS